MATKWVGRDTQYILLSHCLYVMLHHICHRGPSPPFYLSQYILSAVIIKVTRAPLGKTSTAKKRFLSGIARIMEGGVYPCPNFLALFLEVHFLSMKRVYFFKNANVLNF